MSERDYTARISHADTLTKLKEAVTLTENATFSISDGSARKIDGSLRAAATVDVHHSDRVQTIVAMQSADDEPNQ